MSYPRVTGVTPDSAAAEAGIVVGDEFVAINGERPRDILEYQRLVDETELVIDVSRGGLEFAVDIEKAAGAPLGADIESALFDQVRTCDNHCEFCFIYQLPPGMRKSLYLKDDDYRLSFLYGNFTTLTRFTEADLERVIDERLSPINVSIHAIDLDARNEILRNRRGGPTLRWLRALLDAGIEVHGQVVVCPGLNDGAVLDDTLASVLDRFPELASVCVVPLGVSKFNPEPRMRAHTREESVVVVETVEDWQDIFLRVLGRRMVFLADEYYLLADREFASSETYEGFAMYEDGVGMVRTFQAEFHGEAENAQRPGAGFFAWVDGAPAEGYRAPRAPGSVTIMPRASAPVAILTGPLAAESLRKLVAELDRDDVRVIAVANEFFGGNVGVAGLMVGSDLQRVLANEPAGHRYLLPDVCLSGDTFLDGTTPADLPLPVEIIPTDGIALREALALQPSATSVELVS